jgi:hypothetical protein
MSVWAALLAAGLIAGAPGAAKACDPAFCEAWSAVELHTNGEIPADGVIVLRGRYGAPEIPASAVDRVSVTVTGPDQVALAGSLTLVAEPWRAPAMVALVWRPAAALTPGLSYAVAIAVDNQPLGAACDGAPATLESAGSVTARLAGAAGDPADLGGGGVHDRGEPQLHGPGVLRGLRARRGGVFFGGVDGVRGAARGGDDPGEVHRGARGARGGGRPGGALRLRSRG